MTQLRMSLVSVGVLLCGLAGCGRATPYAGGPTPVPEAGAVGPAPCPGGDGGCARSQPILSCDVTNARDLGGLPIAPVGTVACGALFRGPPLAALTTRACQEVARLGIRTVVDLRTESERLGRPDDACLGSTMVLAPLPVPYDVSPANYLADLNTTDSILEAFHAFGDDAAYPIYFHCTYGRDRTGVVAAVILRALGVSREDVMTEYRLSGKTVGAYPDSLTAVLDELDRRGGAEAFLRSLGVSAAELAVLRARAVVQPTARAGDADGSTPDGDADGSARDADAE